MCAPRARGAPLQPLVARSQAHGRGHEAEPSQNPEAGRLQQICQPATRGPGPLAGMVPVQHRAPQGAVRGREDAPQADLVQPRQRAAAARVGDCHCTRLTTLPGPLSRCRQRQAQPGRQPRQGLGRRGDAQLALGVASVFPFTQPPGQTVAGQTSPLQGLAQPAGGLPLQQSQANSHLHPVYPSENPFVNCVPPPGLEVRRRGDLIRAP